MRAKDTIKKTWDVDRTACEALEQIAQEESRNVTAVVNEALKYYADRYYLENKATMLPNDILAAMRSTVNLLEHRLTTGRTSCFPAWRSRCLSSIGSWAKAWS